MKVLPTLFLSLFLLFIFPLTVFATGNITKFPKCPSPGGTAVASYDEGWHWIAGESSLRWGSDQVSKIDDRRLVQCYCPLDGTNNGIQTNWLPVDLVAPNKLQNAFSKGWIWIQSGADFGLEPTPYLALNTNFKCKPDVSVCKQNVSQSNFSKITNSVKSIVTTGINTIQNIVGGNANITTGNATSNVTVINEGNTNVFQSSQSNYATHSAVLKIEGNGDGSINTITTP